MAGMDTFRRVLAVLARFLARQQQRTLPCMSWPQSQEHVDETRSLGRELAKRH